MNDMLATLIRAMRPHTQNTASAFLLRAALPRTARPIFNTDRRDGFEFRPDAGAASLALRPCVFGVCCPRPVLAVLAIVDRRLVVEFTDVGCGFHGPGVGVGFAYGREMLGLVWGRESVLGAMEGGKCWGKSKKKVTYEDP